MSIYSKCSKVKYYLFLEKMLNFCNLYVIIITMNLRQKIELRNYLLPVLQQSLKILPLSLPELKLLIEEKLLDNPFLEETGRRKTLSEYKSSSSYNTNSNKTKGNGFDPFTELVTQKSSLKNVLLNELAMFTSDPLELKIGEEIIGNIDENGYLKATLDEIVNNLNAPLLLAKKMLCIIQRFDPPGIAARDISECLTIQLNLLGDFNPITRQIVNAHLEDLAKKNYGKIAKALKVPPEEIETHVKKILKLNPKPARNFSHEDIQRIIPDVTINDTGDGSEISINNEDLPTLNINKDYKALLKDSEFDPKTKEFLTSKLREAIELLNAINKRHTTLRKIVEIIVEVQQEAISEGLSYLKPLTFKDVAVKLNIHESTVSRAIMNKYVSLPYGTVALKKFFSQGIKDRDGGGISSNFVKKLIKELIDTEDKKHPLSDLKISVSLSELHKLDVKRRTVTKYREGMKILSTPFRRER